MKYECPGVSYCLLWQLVALIASLARSFVGSYLPVAPPPPPLQLRTRAFSDAAVLRRIHRSILAHDTGEIVQSKRKGNDIRVPACHENK